MDLYLVRHGPAEPKRPGPGTTDAARALTRDGRRRLRGVRAGLERRGVRFDRLLFSPLRRAAQTAELLLPLVEGPSTAEPLLASPPSDALLARLAGERPALVGHQPWLGELVAWLVLGDPAQGAAFELKKGAVAHLSGEPRPGSMILVELLAPGTLRDLGRG